MVDRSVLVPMTFRDLERRDVRGQIFLSDLYNCIRTVGTQVGSLCMFCRGQPRPRKGAGPYSVIKIFGTSYIRMPKRFHLEPRHLIYIYGTHVGHERVVSHAPVPNGRGPSVPQIFGPSYVRAHSARNGHQTLHGDQNRRVANFYTVDHEC